jgi:hypothetical protein
MRCIMAKRWSQRRGSPQQQFYPRRDNVLAKSREAQIEAAAELAKTEQPRVHEYVPPMSFRKKEKGQQGETQG